MSLLSLSNVSKTYVAAPALRSVTLTIEPGEIHALVGENGAGKSTLIKILAGAVRPDHADISVDGRAVVIDHPGTAYALGLRFIHQELNVVPALSVAENIFVGRPYPRRLGVLVDWRRLRLAAAAALRRLGITHIDPRRQMAELGTGDRMLVCLSAALLESAGTPARLTVMDEPTASLTAGEAERLFKVLAEIRRSGASVLYVSHRLDEVMRFCDRVTVLRDGAVIATTPVAETSQDEIVRMMIGRRIEGAYPPPLAPAGAEVCLTVRNKNARTALEIRRGEIVGLAGLSGAGQGEVLRRAMGDRGAALVDVAGVSGEASSLRSAWKSGLAYVPGERRSEGLILSRAIFENVTLPHLDLFSLRGALLTPRRERAVAAARGGDVRLKARGPRQLCLELSGGNQQKVVFARALAGEPKVLLLDEPTRGVDVGARFDIYSIIRELAAKGVAVLIASSDFPELIGLCDRIAVMRQGEIAEILDAEGLSEEALVRHCYAAGNGAFVGA